MRLTYLFSTAFVAALTVAACAEDRAQPRTASDQLTTNPVGWTEVTSAKVDAEPAPWRVPLTESSTSDQMVNVGPNLRHLCNVDDSDRAPKFDIDKSTLSGNDRAVLTAVAHCMATGAIQGHDVTLVGRADPRGTEAYNIELGDLRAKAARDFLVSLGVDANHIHDTSRGALDARGRDEESWRLDRRVDIEVQ